MFKQVAATRCEAAPGTCSAHRSCHRRRVYKSARNTASDRTISRPRPAQPQGLQSQRMKQEPTQHSDVDCSQCSISSLSCGSLNCRRATHLAKLRVANPSSTAPDAMSKQETFNPVAGHFGSGRIRVRSVFSLRVGRYDPYPQTSAKRLPRRTISYCDVGHEPTGKGRRKEKTKMARL